MNFNSTEVKSKLLAYSCWSCRHYPFAVIRTPFFFFFTEDRFLYSHIWMHWGAQLPCRYQQEVSGFYKCSLESSVDLQCWALQRSTTGLCWAIAAQSVQNILTYEWAATGPKETRTDLLVSLCNEESPLLFFYFFLLLQEAWHNSSISFYGQYK